MSTCATASSATNYSRSASTTSSAGLGTRGTEPSGPQPCHPRHPHRLAATDELKFHVQIARNNGLTEDEIAEVIYHASGYAGFPAANTAPGSPARCSRSSRRPPRRTEVLTLSLRVNRSTD